MAYEVLKDETKRKAAWARRAKAKVEMIGDSLQLTVHDEDGHTSIPLAYFKAASDMRDALKKNMAILTAFAGSSDISGAEADHLTFAIETAKAALAKADGKKA